MEKGDNSEVNEIMLEKEQLRKNSTYCGSCHWVGGRKPVTCDARMEYMISRYGASPAGEAFLHVMEQAQCKQEAAKIERKLMTSHNE
jgi:hypothetical protein